MAYDPNDPADKKIVDDAVEAATTRLKAKNEELIGEIRKAREGKVDPALAERLERDLEAANTALEEATKAKTKLEKDLKTASDAATANEKRANDMSVASALAKAMTDNKIAPQFHDAVQAMFGPKATFKVDNGAESVLIGDKPLGDAIKEFAASETGKFYVAAGSNGGGGANGGGANGGAKSMTRLAFDALDPGQRADFMKAGGALTDTWTGAPNRG